MFLLWFYLTLAAAGRRRHKNWWVFSPQTTIFGFIGERQCPGGGGRESGARRPVSRVLSPSRSGPGDGHSSGTPVAGRLARSTRAAARKPACRPRPACRPYSILLPVGFTVPSPLPATRCALTAPFHPYPQLAPRGLGGRFAFCGTVPGVAPAGRYPAPCFRGARTFLPPINRKATVRPSDGA